jgi:hypothetical protein
VAAAQRWGARHYRDNHSTPINHDDLSDRSAAAVVLFERNTFCRDNHDPRFYEALMRYF